MIILKAYVVDTKHLRQADLSSQSLNLKKKHLKGVGNNLFFIQLCTKYQKENIPSTEVRLSREGGEGNVVRFPADAAAATT